LSICLVLTPHKYADGSLFQSIIKIMLNHHHKNIATCIHLSTFSRFFIPFGNFLGPLVLWIANKDKSEFIDYHGKQIINFQISILIYAIILGTLSVPFFILTLFNDINLLDFQGFESFNIHVSKPSALLTNT